MNFEQVFIREVNISKCSGFRVIGKKEKMFHVRSRFLEREKL